MRLLEESARLIEEFQRGSLTLQLGALERKFHGLTMAQCKQELPAVGVSPALWSAGVTLKRVAAQVNVLLHATGILLALPHVLDHDEIVLRLSLGAGNTGRDFDLETDRRIAEFTFIDWQGGAESIRQNNLFDDFFRLAEADTDKNRYLYLKGSTYPLRFLKGARALDSVLSRRESLRARFFQLYGDRFRTVHDYYGYRQGRVQIVDLMDVVPEISSPAD